MKRKTRVTLAAFSAAITASMAGDLTVEGSLGVTSNLSAHTLSATNAAVGALAVSGALALPPGSVGTNAAAAGEWNAWGDGRYLGLSGAGDLALGMPGRISAGYGHAPEGMAPSALGAAQVGENYGAQAIGEASSGALQAGWNEGAQTIGVWSLGASQRGYNWGFQSIGDTALGASQRGYNSGTQTIHDNAYGAGQAGYNSGTQAIGSGAFGAEQRGRVAAGACATNSGRGSVQLLDLTNAQWAVMAGHASLGLGACRVTNDQAIVAGDGLASRGDGTVAARAFFGDGAGVTNLDLAAYAGDNLTWAGGRLNAAAAGGAGYTDAQAVAAVSGADLDMGAHRVTGLADPVAGTDAVNRRTVTNLVQDAVQQALLNVGPFGDLSMGTFTQH